VVDGLLRGDKKTRMEAYASAIQNGHMCIDDVRELEDQNPLPDGQGQVFWMAANVVPIERALKPPEPPAPVAPEPMDEPEDAERVKRALRPVAEDAWGRILRRERADVLREAEKRLARGDLAGFRAWAGEFYREHGEFQARAMEPVWAALETLVSDERERAAALASLGGGLTEVIDARRAAVLAAESVDELRGLFDDWQRTGVGDGR
jgi:hypothetical protein